MQELIQCCIISATAELNVELFSYLNFHGFWGELKENFLQFFMTGNQRAENEFAIISTILFQFKDSGTSRQWERMTAKSVAMGWFCKLAPFFDEMSARVFEQNKK